MKDVCSLYEKITEWFDKNRSKHLMEKTYLQRVLHSLPKNATLLDLGCGTGEPIAAFFIKRGHHVTGIDGAPSMIELCKQRFPSMRWEIQDMRTLTLGCTFHAIIAWDSFFHLPPEDQRTMFPLFKAHLNEGGILLFTSGPAYGEVYGTMQGYDFYHASLDSKEYESLLKTYGFKVLQHSVNDPTCGHHTVWIAQLK